MQIKSFSFFILLVCVHSIGLAQDFRISGKIIDKHEQPVGGCNILLISQRDSLDRTFTISENNGTFNLKY